MFQKNLFNRICAQNSNAFKYLFIQYCVSCYSLYQVSSKATSTCVFIIQNVHLILVHLWTTDKKGILLRTSFEFGEEWARQIVLGHNEAKRLLLILFGQKPESVWFSLCICILYYRTVCLQVSQSCWTMIAVKWQMKTLLKGFTILSVVACPNVKYFHTGGFTSEDDKPTTILLLFIQRQLKTITNRLQACSGLLLLKSRTKKSSIHLGR